MPSTPDEYLSFILAILGLFILWALGCIIVDHWDKMEEKIEVGPRMTISYSRDGAWCYGTHDNSYGYVTVPYFCDQAAIQAVVDEQIAFKQEQQL